MLYTDFRYLEQTRADGASGFTVKEHEPKIWVTVGTEIKLQPWTEPALGFESEHLVERISVSPGASLFS